MNSQVKRKLHILLENVGDMSLKRRARNIIEGLDLKKGERVVDLGCGDGYFLYLLDSLGLDLKITGLDYDSWALKRGRENLGSRKIKLIQGSVTKLPFQSNFFDKAIMTEVLEHVEKDNTALKEVYRILKPRGIIALTVPNWDFPFLWDPFNWILQRFFNTHITTDFWSGIWLGHLRLYKNRDLQNKILKTGFKLEQFKQLTSWCLPFNHYLVNIVARLLYSNKLPVNCANSIYKFKSAKKPFVVRTLFIIVNLLDKLNEILPIGPGLNIYAKAVKE